MSNQSNEERVRAILASDIDSSEIAFYGNEVSYPGHEVLSILFPCDFAVLAKLMETEELLWALDSVEFTCATLRKLQNGGMTDERALIEINEAKGVLDKHIDNGFLLGVWTEDEGFCYRYVDGRYADRAEKGYDDAA